MNRLSLLMLMMDKVMLENSCRPGGKVTVTIDGREEEWFETVMWTHEKEACFGKRVYKNKGRPYSLYISIREKNMF